MCWAVPTALGWKWPPSQTREFKQSHHEQWYLNSVAQGEKVGILISHTHNRPSPNPYLFPTQTVSGIESLHFHTIFPRSLQSTPSLAGTMTAVSTVASARVPCRQLTRAMALYDRGRITSFFCSKRSSGTVRWKPKPLPRP